MIHRNSTTPRCSALLPSAWVGLPGPLSPSPSYACGVSGPWAPLGTSHMHGCSRQSQSLPDTSPALTSLRALGRSGSAERLQLDSLFSLQACSSVFPSNQCCLRRATLPSQKHQEPSPFFFPLTLSRFPSNQHQFFLLSDSRVHPLPPVPPSLSSGPHYLPLDYFSSPWPSPCLLFA